MGICPGELFDVPEIAIVKCLIHISMGLSESRDPEDIRISELVWSCNVKKEYLL